MPKRGDPSVLRLVVAFLRSYANLTQAEFGKASRVDQGLISRYEAGHQAPPEESLRRMARAAKVPWPLVVLLTRFIEAFLAALNRRRSVAPAVDPGVLEPALYAVTGYLIEAEAAAHQRLPEEELREAGEIWAALEEFPIPQRRRLIGLSLRASRSCALAVRACEASVQAAAHRAEEALEVAKLALFIASRVPGESLRCRTEGYCWAHIGNARRVGEDHDGADEAFDRAWELWRAGADTKLLSEWMLLALEASFRREQHRFSEALKLLDQAMASCGGGNPAACTILFAKEHVFNHMGDIGGALAALAEAVPFVEASGDPRLLFALRFNMADDLSHLDRFEEAALLLPQVHQLAVQQGDRLSLIRVAWLTTKVAAGEGRTEEAIVGLEQVRQAFIANDLPYDAALASLDLAVLWLNAGRTAAVRGLAVEMEAIFKAKKVHREALAAFSLFCEAAKQEVATVELVRQVGMSLARAGRVAGVDA